MSINGTIHHKPFFVIVYNDGIFEFLCFNAEAIKNMEKSDSSGFSKQTRDQDRAQEPNRVI